MAYFYRNPADRLRPVADRIAKVGFVGGGLARFEEAGRAQLISLLQVGLYPDARVLDIGCGCLRGGYWLIHFLRPDCYFGIEPNKAVLEAGLSELFDPLVLEEKRPRFDYNDAFDLSVFDQSFDVVIARSIWTHAPKKDVLVMLDGFHQVATPTGIMLTSVLLPGEGNDKADYAGSDWVGKSHTSDVRGTIAHDYGWIETECARRSLAVERVPVFEHGKQVWLLVSRA